MTHSSQNKMLGFGVAGMAPTTSSSGVGDTREIADPGIVARHGDRRAPAGHVREEQPATERRAALGG
jgi:hypothetical protein